MGRISNLHSYNENRKELIKVKTSSEQTILLSNDEAKEVLKNFISEDLDLFATGIAKDVKNKLDNKIAHKLTNFELSILQHIDNKFNKLTEKVMETILSHKFEIEVERRLNEKLQKIKNAL